MSNKQNVKTERAAERDHVGLVQGASAEESGVDSKGNTWREAQS